MREVLQSFSVLISGFWAGGSLGVFEGRVGYRFIQDSVMSKIIEAHRKGQGKVLFVFSPPDEGIQGLVKGFRNYGYAVKCSYDYSEPLDLLKEHLRPSAVLIAAAFKEPPALKLVQRLKAARAYQRVPFLVLMGEKTDIKAFQKAGCRGGVRPPFSSYKMAHLIDHLVQEANGSSRGLNFHQQVSGVVVAIVLFIAFLVYYILIPMFARSS